MCVRRLFLLITLFLVMSISLACVFSLGNTSNDSQESSDQYLAATAQALSHQLMQTSQAQQINNPSPTITLPPPSPTLLPTSQPTEEPEPTPHPTEEVELIKDLSINRNKFFCVKSDGPTTVTFTIEMTDIDRGLAIFWRLVDKSSGKTTDWQNVSMTRKTTTARTFTFDANVWDGTNNFFYPPLYGESWFQFQLISGDAKYRTGVYHSEITFFPCAQ